jgi:hypothetical protein
MPLLWNVLRRYFSIDSAYAELILDSREDAAFAAQFGTEFHRVRTSLAYAKYMLTMAASCRDSVFFWQAQGE